MVVIFEEGLLRTAIRWAVQWGATDSHVVFRVWVFVDHVRGRIHPRLCKFNAIGSHNVVGERGC